MPKEQRKQMHGGAPDAKPRGGGGKPFNVKVDEVVGKIVPHKWLGTTFAGTAVGALLLFIFVILALVFAGGMTDEEAQAEITRLRDEAKTKAAEVRKEIGDLRDKQRTQVADLAEKHKTVLAVERKAHDETQKQFKLARAFKLKADKYDRAEENLAKSRTEVEGLKRDIKKQTADIRKLRDVEKRATAAEKREKEAKLGLAGLRKELDESKATKSAADDAFKRAEQVFKGILEDASAIADPEAKLKRLNELLEERRADLSGTVFEERLQKHIDTAGKAVAKKSVAEAKKQARDTEREYKKALATAKEAKSDYGRKIEILSDAATALVGTPFGEKLTQQVKELIVVKKKAEAAAIYKAVMARIEKKENRAKHRENLEALREALAQIEDEGYAARLEKMIKTKSATVDMAVARAAFEELGKQIKQNPKNHQDNIAAAQAALAETGETRFRAQVEGIIRTQTARLEDATGKQCYDDAIRQLKSSKDATANVTVLEGLKARCKEGSSWANKIEKLLKTQRKKAAREQPG